MARRVGGVGTPAEWEAAIDRADRATGARPDPGVVALVSTLAAQRVPYDRMIATVTAAAGRAPTLEEKLLGAFGRSPARPGPARRRPVLPAAAGVH